MCTEGGPVMCALREDLSCVYCERTCHVCTVSGPVLCALREDLSCVHCGRTCLVCTEGAPDSTMIAVLKLLVVITCIHYSVRASKECR